MTDHGKAQIQALGAGLVGFVVVVGAGAALMLHHGGSPIKAPASSYAPVDAASALSVPAAAVKPSGAGTPMGETGSAASSPAPLLPASERAAESEAAAAPAEAASGPAAQTPSFSRKLVVTQHLDGTSSAKSSARATVAAAPAKPDSRPAKKPFLAPKLDLSKTQSALASSVHYGVSSRAELMGRAAGPVYNFSGKNAAAKQIQAPSQAGAIQQMDAAQQQIDASPLEDSDKAALKANLGQVRQAVQATADAQSATAGAQGK